VNTCSEPPPPELASFSKAVARSIALAASPVASVGWIDSRKLSIESLSLVIPPNRSAATSGTSKTIEALPSGSMFFKSVRAPSWATLSLVRSLPSTKPIIELELSMTITTACSPPKPRILPILGMARRARASSKNKSSRVLAASSSGSRNLR